MAVKIMKSLKPVLFVTYLAIVAAKASEDTAAKDKGRWTCKTKKEQCKFPSESDYFTECKTDAVICACSGNEACSKCENDKRDPDDLYFCEAKMSDLDPKYEYMYKPWVKCSNDCFDGCKLVFTF